MVKDPRGTFGPYICTFGPWVVIVIVIVSSGRNGWMTSISPRLAVANGGTYYIGRSQIMAGGRPNTESPESHGISVLERQRVEPAGWQGVVISSSLTLVVVSVE